MHFAEAAVDPLTKIPGHKACAMHSVPAVNEDLARPEVRVGRGRY